LARLQKLKDWFVRISLVVKVLLLLALVLLGWFGKSKLAGSNKTAVQYQTATVQKGTLISAVSGSGSITSGNYTNITTKTSGVVKKVYVTNGDKVTKGQKIAEITLDDYARERQTAAWVAYLEATEAVKDAQTAKATADIKMWQDRETLLGAIEDYNDNEGDTEGEKIIVQKTVDQARLALGASELKYLNADSDVANAQAKVSAALRNYQENSAAIVAPASGVVSDLALAEGLTVSANSTTSSTSGATIVSGQTVGKISDPEGQLIATVSLSEIDVVGVKANQKVTLTLDAYSDKTFTGKVLAVNTSGSVSSGVTSYPVTILLDPVAVEVYPNMGVNASVITLIKNDVILIPSTAVMTDGGQSIVQVKKGDQIGTVEVEIGSSNDSQVEIISGLSEKDEVVTSTISSNNSQSSDTTTSPFSGLGRTGGGTQRIFQGPGGF